MSKKLNDTERSEALASLEGWTLCTDRDAIQKNYRFKNFKRAFAWMTAVALEAEQADHHPEWSNVYNQVTIDLVTHDVAAITQLDLDLAAVIDSLA